MKYQLVPSHDHIWNIAEKAIQVFKYHSVSVLCGTNKNFPLQLWCQILPHTEHQLNLIRKSRVVQTISDFAHMYGQHDYDTYLFAPLGCEVKMCVIPSGRKAKESHTKTGYYLGTSWEHYWCHKGWIQEIKSTRVGQKVFFKHRNLTQPTITVADALLQAGDDICNAQANIFPATDKT